MKKIYSMPDRYTKFIKEEAIKLEIAESEFLRRVIDTFIEDHRKTNVHQNL
jgi:hypothetical protein